MPRATPPHAKYYTVSRHVQRHLTPGATLSHATYYAISRHVPRHLMHAILTPVNWRNVAESFWTIVAHCIRCGRFTDRCGTLRCLMVHCVALQKCYGRLVGHSGAFRCVAVQCGNVVEGLRQWTIAVHRSVLWCDAYVVEGLRTIVIPCSALRCIAVHCTYVMEGL